MIEALYTVVLIEAVLGGGGRVFPVGPVTLRMLLFASCLAVWLVAAMYRKRSDGQGLAFLIVTAFIGSVLPGLVIVAVSGISGSRALGDILPMLFWITAPFVAMAIYSQVLVDRAAQIIMYGGLLVASTILAILIALTANFLPFAQFYNWATQSSEIFFRSGMSFFFKGHFYVGIALIFTVTLKPRHWKLMSVILALSIVASLTRGLMFATLLAVILALISTRSKGSLLLLVLAVVCVGVIYGQEIFKMFFGDESRAVSFAVRLDDFKVFLEAFTERTLFFGNGAGALLNDRQNFENSYMWGLFKFGIIGLTFMISPFVICLYYYRKVRGRGHHQRLAAAYFFGMVMLYVLTAINPFINNSIGISYALVAIFSLRRLSRPQIESARITKGVQIR